MKYLLLTGATGFLGRYLLKDLLVAEQPVAVLVRRSRAITAFEKVETVLTYWENVLGRSLPRPVVLEGDIGEHGLGLSGTDRDWVGRHCQSVLHCAAVLKFQAEEPEGEPYITNVDGTRHLIDFCEAAGISRMHHISTAYVCGARPSDARILESELDCGQSMCNDYERSKMAAEQMLQQSSVFKELTIYRPSIIVGDAQTGYATTFHGFYTPLRMIYSFVDRSQLQDVELHDIVEIPFLSLLRLEGHERKNLVPVDWVSEATCRIVTDPKLHGKTYHITTPDPVPVTLIYEVFAHLFLETEAANSGVALFQGSGFNSDLFSEAFVEQMRVYEAYWRDDPVFDSGNLMEALPDLSCPELDREKLWKIGKYAINSNFGWPLEKPVARKYDFGEILGTLGKRLEKTAGQSLPPATTSQFGLQITGNGGGDWCIHLRDGQVSRVERGFSEMNDSDSLYYLSSNSFENILSGNTSAATLIKKGKLLCLRRSSTAYGDAGIEATQLNQVISQYRTMFYNGTPIKK